MAANFVITVPVPSQSPTDYSILSPSYLTDLLTDELCNAVALLHFEVNVGEVEEEHLQQQFNYGENNKRQFRQVAYLSSGGDDGRLRRVKVRASRVNRSVRGHTRLLVQSNEADRDLQ
eukprot:PDM78570.1 hypothetical protein PRIPAC_31149 [Pristionchus pacificus]